MTSTDTLEALVAETWRDLEIAASAKGRLEAHMLHVPVENVRAILEDRRSLRGEVERLTKADKEWGRLHQTVIEERAEALREVERLQAERQKPPAPARPEAGETARLRRELASRAIRTMGPRSPFWNCTICGSAYLTPLSFRHKSGCLLCDEPTTVLVDGPPSFHSIEVQHAIMRDALIAIAEINFGTTGLAAKAALEAISKPETRS